MAYSRSYRITPVHWAASLLLDECSRQNFLHTTEEKPKTIDLNISDMIKNTLLTLENTINT